MSYLLVTLQSPTSSKPDSSTALHCQRSTVTPPLKRHSPSSLGSTDPALGHALPRCLGYGATPVHFDWENIDEGRPCESRVSGVVGHVRAQVRVGGGDLQPVPHTHGVCVLLQGDRRSEPAAIGARWRGVRIQEAERPSHQSCHSSLRRTREPTRDRSWRLSSELYAVHHLVRYHSGHRSRDASRTLSGSSANRTRYPGLGSCV